jgi:hypothetical protein
VKENELRQFLNHSVPVSKMTKKSKRTGRPCNILKLFPVSFFENNLQGVSKSCHFFSPTGLVVKISASLPHPFAPAVPVAIVSPRIALAVKHKLLTKQVVLLD